MWIWVLLGLLLTKSATLSDLSFYEILGVEKDASQQQIRQAYKKLAVKLHPDKNPNDTEQDKFMKITEAYETLKDPEKRRRYNIYGVNPSYTRQYDSRSQAEYNTMYYQGLYHDDENVDTLTGKNYQNYVTEGLYFVSFYSPFCPPCQSLSDDWKKLAKVYKDVVKVGAVNCKYYNSFCYNVMRINSYPTLLFYPDGKSGGYVYYSGERSYRALEQFVLQYLRRRITLSTVSRRVRSERPVLYLLVGSEEYALRVAYRLRRLMTVYRVNDATFRASLGKDDLTALLQTSVGDTPLYSDDEGDLLQECLQLLSTPDQLDAQGFQKIRNKLRNGSPRPYVIYFAGNDASMLPLYTMQSTYPKLQFGRLDCELERQLCSSLQMSVMPGWGVLKPGGGYQVCPDGCDVTSFLTTAPWCTNLHSLSLSEALRVLDGEMGIWLVAVVPRKAIWETVSDAFMKTAHHFIDDDKIKFGIMACTEQTNVHCRKLSGDHIALVLQNGTERHIYSGRYDQVGQIVQFVELLRNDPVTRLDPGTLQEVMNHRTRSANWAVAFFPADCPPACAQLRHQWRIVAQRLSPLPEVRVGAVECGADGDGDGGDGDGDGGSTPCGDSRSPRARVYARRTAVSYVTNLQQLSEAAYMMEWVLEYLTPELTSFTWNTFMQTVLYQDMTTTNNKKPWLIYFKSPRCYYCYEMYPDFVIAAYFLSNALDAGKVNCLSERSLCQNEQVAHYPSLKLYLGATSTRAFSSVINIPLGNYDYIIENIKPHLQNYDEKLVESIEKWGAERPQIHIKHDEF